MSFARRLLCLMLALLFIGAAVQAQTPRSTDDPRNQAPTVNGGTGLFTVYDAQTLRKGEFNFGFFANHFHRDPADVTWQVYPVNFQVGFNDHLEIFAHFEAQRVVSVGSPALLSGFYLPDVRTKTLPVGRLVIVPGQNTASFTIGDPCGNGGFPGPCRAPNVGGLGGFASGPFVARPSGNNTAVYVGLGAPVGGILPALAPNVNPNYLPNAPFLARFSDHHTGDIWVGGKIRFTGPKNPFGFALIPLLKIPTTSELFTGLERGRGTGQFDYGVIAAFDGRLHKYINLSTNIGYIKRGDPEADDMNLGPLCVGCNVIQGFGSSTRSLDVPDELRSGVGVDFPLSQYLQLITEVSATHYVG
ncbi:MAG: transporter, partial [Blastocatellia bacterium]